MVPSPSSSSLPSSPSNNAFPMLLREDSPSSRHENLSTSLSPTSLAFSSDGFQYDIIDMRAVIGIINGEIPARIPRQVDLAHTIEEKVISIQGLLDASNVPITIQGKIFEQVFQKKEEHQHQAMTLTFSMFMYSESNSIPHFAPSSWNTLEDF